jgi:hypothetical protein
LVLELKNTQPNVTVLLRKPEIPVMGVNFVIGHKKLAQVDNIDLLIKFSQVELSFGPGCSVSTTI